MKNPNVALAALGWIGEKAGTAWAAADRRLSTPRAQSIAILCAATAVFAFRLPTVMTRPTAGIDYGHYLSTAHWLMGLEPTQFGTEAVFGYHFLLVALILVLPETTATVVSGPLVAAALIPGCFLLARRAMSPLAALACAGLLAMMQNISEMIAWGGNPNLLAICFSLVMWRYLLDTVTADPAGKGWRRPAVFTGLFLGLTIITHAFTAFITLVTVAVFLVGGLAMRRFSPRALAWPSAFATAIAAAVTAPAAPLYFTLATQGSLGPGSAGGNPFDPVFASLDYLHRDTPLLWLVAWAMALGATALLLARRDLFGLYLAAAIATPVALAATQLSSHVPRTLYFLDAPLALGVAAAGVLLWQNRGRVLRLPGEMRRPAVLAMMVALIVLVPPSSLYRESLSVDFYNHLNRDHVEAFDWIRTHTNASQAVWTDGSLSLDPEGRAGEMFGFWIEGYARRPSLYTARPEDLAYAYQQDSARDACRVLQGDRGAENGLLRVGSGADLSVPAQPTLAIVAGLDYHVVVTGEDLGLEASASIFRLSQGLRTADATLEQEGARVWFNDSATFTTPNNWSGGANTSLQLAGAGATYRIEAYSDGFELPWVHKDFRLTPSAQLVSADPDTHAPAQTLHFRLPAGFATPQSRFSMTFSVTDPASALEIAWQPFGAAHVVSATVSGGASRPVLLASFTWDDPEPLQNAPATVRLFHAKEILSTHNVRLLFVERAQESLAIRFDAQPTAYRRVFENPTVALFEVAQPV